MTFRLLLVLALTLTIAFTLFPNIAQESLSIEALGWHFETQQGTFVILVLIVLLIAWLVQRFTEVLAASPGKAWQTLRTGGKQRREQHLQAAFKSYVDMDIEHHQRAFKKARVLLPVWAQPLWERLSLRPSQQDEPNLQHAPLDVAWTARLVSDPEWKEQVKSEQRKEHLKAWLQVHPHALLAEIRLLDIYLEEGEWQEAWGILQGLKNQALRSQAWILDKKVLVLLALHKKAGEGSQTYLQQAEKISPHHVQVVLARGQALIQANKVKDAEKLWLNHLKKHDDLSVAQAAWEIMKDDGLAAFRRMEKMKGSDALLWLHASLAHVGKLDGLAEETLKPLLKHHPCPLFWQTWAQWLAQKGEHQQAFDAYEQAIAIQNQCTDDKGWK